MKIKKIIAEKSVLFISTKNRDYVRNSQEIELIAAYASKIEVLAFSDKNYFFRVIKVYLGLIKRLFQKKNDVIFIGFAPQLLFLFFPFFRQQELVIDFFISMYDTFVDDRKYFKDTSFISKLFHKVDSFVLHKADHIIADTKAHAKYFSQEFDVPINKIEVLYIEADTSIYQSFEKKKENDKFEIVYFGSILPVQGIEVVLSAIQSLSNRSDLHFTIIGPVEQKLKISIIDYPNTTFINWLEQTKLSEILNQSDLALSGHFSSTVGKANRTIAGKTYIYRAMNLPVILGESDANHELFKADDRDYFYVERGDSTKLAEKILFAKEKILAK